MNSRYVRSGPSFPVLSSSGRFVKNEDRSKSYKLVDSVYNPFYSDYYDAYSGEEYFHRPRTADNYYGIRQEYLRSYTFTREEPKPEKGKKSLKRFKAVVWAVLCFRKFKHSQSKMVREKLSSRSSRFIHESTGYISASCRKISVPGCVRFSSVEVS